MKLSQYRSIRCSDAEAAATLGRLGEGEGAGRLVGQLGQKWGSGSDGLGR
jgi:hypothetical protein